MIPCEIHSLRALPKTLSLPMAGGKLHVEECALQIGSAAVAHTNKEEMLCRLEFNVEKREKTCCRKQSKSCEMVARARNSDDDDAEKCSQNLPYRIQPKTQRPIPSNDTIVLQHQHLPIQVIIDQQKHRQCQDLPGPCQHHPRWTETF